MKIKELVSILQQIQELHPGADIYFTHMNKHSSYELDFCLFNIDDENNNIEMLFTTDN